MVPVVWPHKNIMLDRKKARQTRQDANQGPWRSTDNATVEVPLQFPTKIDWETTSAPHQASSSSHELDVFASPYKSTMVTFSNQPNQH